MLRVDGKQSAIKEVFRLTFILRLHAKIGRVGPYKIGRCAC